MDCLFVCNILESVWVSISLGRRVFTWVRWVPENINLMDSYSHIPSRSRFVKHHAHAPRFTSDLRDQEACWCTVTLQWLSHHYLLSTEIHRSSTAVFACYSPTSVSFGAPDSRENLKQIKDVFHAAPDAALESRSFGAQNLLISLFDAD